MGSWFSRDIQAEANFLLDGAVHQLVDMKPDGAHDTKESITYLKREDVHSKLAQLIESYDLRTFPRGGFATVLGLVFLELIAVDGKDAHWRLNFWPCTECACVGIEPALSDIENQ